MMVKSEETEVILNAQPKSENNQKIERTFTTGACRQTECGTADDFQMGTGGFT